MPLFQSDLIEIRRVKGKGRGVFARQPIPKNSLIERVPLVIVAWEGIEESELSEYVYCWTDRTAAVALGYGSMYNHSFRPNARYVDLHHRVKEFIAIRDIRAGEEITVNYNGDPKDQTNELGFTVLD